MVSRIGILYKVTTVIAILEKKMLNYILYFLYLSMRYKIMVPKELWCHAKYFSNGHSNISLINIIQLKLKRIK